MAAKIIDGKALAARIRSELAVEARSFTNGAISPGSRWFWWATIRVRRSTCATRPRRWLRLGIAASTTTCPPLPRRPNSSTWCGRCVPTAQWTGCSCKYRCRPTSTASASCCPSIRPRTSTVPPREPGPFAHRRAPFHRLHTYGIMKLIEEAGTPVRGASAVVVGRSNIVGKPVAVLLTAADATVTICHSKTKDLPGVIGRRTSWWRPLARPR